MVNPRPHEVFFVTPLPNEGGGLFLQHPPWIFDRERLIPLDLLPVYRYGSPVSIDTKISTIELHMTLL